MLAWDFGYSCKTCHMPWYNGDYPPSYKNQPLKLRDKAVEIANEMLLHGVPEGIAIATGLKRARDFYAGQVGGGSRQKRARKRIK
jgi:hypothetical protein